MKRKVILDTDAGADDLLAIALALLSRKVEVSAIISSYGNFALEESSIRISRFLEELNVKKIPLLMGGFNQPLQRDYKPSYEIHGKDLLDRRTSSDYSFERMEGLADLTRFATAEGEDAGKLTYICLGPLTNLSEMIASFRPEMIDKVIIMGGAFYFPGNATLLSEANFHWDPEAVEVVLSQKRIPLYVIPLNVTEYFQIALKRLGKLRKSKLFMRLFKPYTNYYINKKKFFIEPITFKERPYAGGVIHDVLATIYAIDSKVVSFSPLKVSLEFLKRKRGMVVPILRGEEIDSRMSYISNINVATNVDTHRFWKIFDGVMKAR